MKTPILRRELKDFKIMFFEPVVDSLETPTVLGSNGIEERYGRRVIGQLVIPTHHALDTVEYPGAPHLSS